MYQQLKFPFAQANNIFFVSDMHLRHDRDFIWSRRGFQSVAEQDGTLVKRWNETCDENSLVFHLGDFIFNDADGKEFEKYANLLNYKRLYLLTGNHNSGQRQFYFRKVKEALGTLEAEVYPFKVDINSEKALVFLPTLIDIFVANQPITLCHYALRNFVSSGKGAWHLCGHSHGNDEGINPACQERKVLDVGIENFGGPIPFSKVVEIMNTKEQEALDHHV